MAWTADDIEAGLRNFLAGRDRWPRRREFEAAGQAALVRAVYRNGGAAHWARRMGVAYPPERGLAAGDFYTRPDKSKQQTKLARVRLDRGISQAELARRATMSRAKVTRLETGDAKDPSLRTLVNLALVLGVPLVAIVEDEWMRGSSLDGSRHRPRGTARWDEPPADAPPAL